MSGGHVFVVLGRIESVVHDVAVVSTSGAFRIREYWLDLLGSSGAAVDRHRPVQLAEKGYGPSPVDERLWFVSVGAAKRSRLEEIHSRLSATIEEIAALGVRAGANREKLLVAVPVIGIEGGGLGERRGEVLKGQLEVCVQLARQHDIDIAVVTPDRAVYGAAQYLRTQLRTPAGWDLSPHLQDEARRIGALARSGELALFLGAGVSLPAGLPTWDELIGLLSNGRLGLKESSLSALDQAQLIELRSEPGELGQRVAEITSAVKRPSLGHALLASLETKEIVTTNYDRLFETAVMAVDDEPIAILPWETSRRDRPWILKMHGDIMHADKIVLTRRHFVQFDANVRPAGALLQSLLMTRHLLVVGASLNDDNVVRLAHEVQAYRETHGLEGRFGTLLDLDGDPLREELWSGQLDWITLPGGDVVERARGLEIFLDAVAAAASSNSSWLLDQRFEDLLNSDNSRKRASLARQLFRTIPYDSKTWAPLRELLVDLGAESGK
ncbi:SIR2 family protein [Nocardioides sp. CPCC 206347]|uniref:SIR2 family protein n=1 Tax=unclassified Nocardioides TaxID=2615069 RepID=UPI00360C933B